jgi:alkylhydroperoxidase family enzyme
MGFTDVERIDVPFVLEYSDPDTYARALASTGPAFEAIQAVGEQSFLDWAVQLAQERVRDGLPLRAPLALVGYLAVKPVEAAPRANTVSKNATSPSRSSFLAPPPPTPETQRMFDDDLEGLGYVANVSRLWAHLPSALQRFSDLLAETTSAGSLTDRGRAVLVTSAASALGDSYCSLAWGMKLAEASSPEVAAGVVRGGTQGLDDDDKALATWARLIARDPNAITSRDVDALRRVGFKDGEIFAITAFVALRLAFSTVNDALGTVPDRELSATAPELLRSAVVFGRRHAVVPENRGPTDASFDNPMEK